MVAIHPCLVRPRQAVIQWCLAQRCPLQSVESALKLELHASFVRHAAKCTKASAVGSQVAVMAGVRDGEVSQAPPLFPPDSGGDSGGDFLCRCVVA